MSDRQLAVQGVFQGDVKDLDSDPVHQMELWEVPIIGAVNGYGT
jgi:hypothetical protein